MAKNKTKINAILIAVIVVAGAVLALQYWQKDKVVPVSTGKPAEPPPSLSVQNLDTSVIPSGIPGGFPMEKGTEVMQNYETINTETDTAQSTRVFATKKSLQENFNLYKKYLADNQWVITATTDEKVLKSLAADKNGQHADVIISSNGDTSQKTINISITSPLER